MLIVPFVLADSLVIALYDVIASLLGPSLDLTNPFIEGR